MEKLVENFNEIMTSGDSVSLFTNFQNKNIRVIDIEIKEKEILS